MHISNCLSYIVTQAINEGGGGQIKSRSMSRVSLEYPSQGDKPNTKCEVSDS